MKMIKKYSGDLKIKEYKRKYIKNEASFRLPFLTQSKEKDIYRVKEKKNLYTKNSILKKGIRTKCHRYANAESLYL